MCVGDGRVAEPAGVGVGADGAVGHADELRRAHRAGRGSRGCRAPRPGPRRRCRVADAKPSFVPAIVSRNGARWSRSGSSSRGPTCGVPESLVFAGNGSPGVERADRDLAGAREGRRDLLRRPARRRSLRRAAVERDRPDVEAAARERARGVGEQAAVAAPGRHRDDLVAAGQPLQAAAVAPDHVEARGALAGVLADERDPAPVGRPVRVAVAAAARHLPLADVEVAVAHRDDGVRQARAPPRPPRSRRRPRAGAAAPARPRSGGVELGPPCRRMLPDPGGRQRGCRRRTPSPPRRASRPGRRRRPRRRRARARRRAAGRAKTAASSAASSSCASGDELALGQLGPPDQLAEPDEELRLERADGQVAAVGGLVDPVAGEPAGEEARQRVAAEPVRDEAVRAVRHRDRQPGAAAGALALEQRGQDLRHGAERAGGEVGGLERRQRRARCPRARPPSRGS